MCIQNRCHSLSRGWSGTSTTKVVPGSYLPSRIFLVFIVIATVPIFIIVGIALIGMVVVVVVGLVCRNVRVVLAMLVNKIDSLSSK